MKIPRRRLHYTDDLLDDEIDVEPRDEARGERERALEEGVTRTTQFAEFVNRHADNLTDFAKNVWNAPGVINVIDMFRHLFRTMHFVIDADSDRLPLA
jgi:hypothetical protein